MSVRIGHPPQSSVAPIAAPRSSAPMSKRTSLRIHPRIESAARASGVVAIIGRTSEGVLKASATLGIRSSRRLANSARDLGRTALAPTRVFPFLSQIAACRSLISTACARAETHAGSAYLRSGPPPAAITASRLRASATSARCYPNSSPRSAKGKAGARGGCGRCARAARRSRRRGRDSGARR